MRFYKLILLGLVGAMMFVNVASARFYMNPVDTSSSWVELPVVPGTTVSSEFNLVNGVDEVRTFDLAVVHAEATEEENGFFALASNEAAPQGVGLWGDLQLTEIKLEGNESEVIGVDFSVPEGTPYGEYWGGIAAMVKDDSTDNDDGLQIAIRNGMRVHLSVMPQEDYDALTALAAEEPASESETAPESFDYALWLQVGILAVILAILIAFLKFRQS